PFPSRYPAYSPAHSIAKATRPPHPGKPGLAPGGLPLDKLLTALVAPAFVAPFPRLGGPRMLPQPAPGLPGLVLQAPHGLVAQVIAAPRGVGPGIAGGNLGAVGRVAVRQHQRAHIALELVLFIALRGESLAAQQLFQVPPRRLGVRLAGLARAMAVLGRVDAVQADAVLAAIDPQGDGIAIVPLDDSAGQPAAARRDGDAPRRPRRRGL